MARTNRRQEIIEAAVHLMAEGGPEALTASALARAAGVSKANLFHHFGRLDDVVLAAFEQFVLGLESVRGSPPTSLRGWLLGLGHEATTGDATRLNRAYFAFFARAMSDAALRRRAGEIADLATAAFGETIRAFRPSATAGEIAALARLVLIAGDGLALHHALFPEHAAAQDAAWRTLVELIAPMETTR